MIMDTTQVIEFNNAFGYVFPSFLGLFGAILAVGVVCSIVKKFVRIH